MREIKFRGRTYEDKNQVTFRLADIIIERSFPIDINPYSIEEYTGNFDKNGKEICEGDILKFFTPTNSPATQNEVIVAVTWFEGLFITFKMNGIPFPLRETIIAYSQYGGVEIIGNIYEHPHLLQQSHD